MPEPIKDNKETSSENAKNQTLKANLESIKKKQKKKSILAKLSDFFRGRAVKESEYPKATQDDQDNPKQYKSLRQRAIEEIESEHIYVKGGPEAIHRKMLEIEARDRAEQQQKPLSVERVPHRHEKQNERTDNDNSNESNAS